MFIAATYVLKRFVQLFHLWLNELGSCSGSNGGSGARSSFAAIRYKKESVPSLVANVLSNWDYVRSDSHRFLRLLELTALSLAHGIFIIHFSDHMIISDYIIMYY